MKQSLQLRDELVQSTSEMLGTVHDCYLKKRGDLERAAKLDTHPVFVGRIEAAIGATDHCMMTLVELLNSAASYVQAEGQMIVEESSRLRQVFDKRISASEDILRGLGEHVTHAPSDSLANALRLHTALNSKLAAEIDATLEVWRIPPVLIDSAVSVASASLHELFTRDGSQASEVVLALVKFVVGLSWWGAGALACREILEALQGSSRTVREASGVLTELDEYILAASNWSRTVALVAERLQVDSGGVHDPDEPTY